MRGHALAVQHRSSRSRGRILGLLAAVVLIVGACGNAPAPTGSGESGNANNPPSSLAPGETTAAPAPPLATPVLVDGIEDQSALVPPIPEEGEVPPAEPATPAAKGTLTLAAPVELAAATIEVSGGTITVNKPGDPLNGLTIVVPAGAYAAAVPFRVSSSPISASSFGDGLTPVSPLVTIDNGGAVLVGDPVLVTIPATMPATVPEGSAVFGLYYHGDSGSIDPLTTVEQAAASTTLAATHFSDIYLALADLIKIGGTVDSGFRPGVDDWQFTNYGSFVVPNGHCEGQSVSAIWYYKNQRQGGGASALYGLFDNNGDGHTPTFWPDDSDAYRFASAVQADAIVMPATYNYFNSLHSGGTLTYNLFKAAIAATGAPQLISIADSAGKHGHAMIVYRVTPTRLYVADPNYPARLRTVAYDAATGVLGPYSSGDNAGAIAAGGATSYQRFAYIPAGSSSSDSGVAAHWAEFETGKSGNAIFPAYDLEVWTGVDDAGNDKWEPLGDIYATPDLKLRVRLPLALSDQATMRIYKAGTNTGISGWGRELTIDLVKDSVNNLGFYEMGAKNGAWKYVNFDRVTVTQGLIDINGTWTGIMTFNDIKVDVAAAKKAEDELGCDIAILDALRNVPIPMTLTIVADKTGKGTASMLLDAQSVVQPSEEPSSPPEPVPLTLTYTDGVITFDLGTECSASGASCSMTGTPVMVDKVETINGTVSMSGEGYSANAVWTVTRADE